MDDSYEEDFEDNVEGSFDDLPADEETDELADFIDSILSDDYVESNEAFENIIGMKITERLENIQPYVFEDSLEELSKKTLDSYINKAEAHRDRMTAVDHAIGASAEIVNKLTQNKGDTKADRYLKNKMKNDQDNVRNIIRRRDGGIEAATRRLTKENAELAGIELSEEELNELSKSTLASYVNKATVSHKDLGDEHDSLMTSANHFYSDKAPKGRGNKDGKKKKNSAAIKSDNEFGNLFKDAADEVQRKRNRREVGIVAANKKLTGE